ncbi:MAG: glycoside hydrolase, partial [Clostridiales bacterium]|nr:glycoside hydrolase [Clostridiales bacterium]
MTIDLKGNGLWGFGERFDKVNQIGLSRENHVYEVFTNQGANAYIPVPFCFTDAGEGLFVAASERFEFRSEKTDHGIRLEIPGGLEIKRFHGTPSEMLDQFGKCVKHPKLPPAWAFGLWISANRWNTQAIALEQAELSIRHGMKPSVIVLEAWSDETTFYRFDEKRFPDPAGMIKRLHDMGIRVILWQVPVFKKLEPGVSDPVHAADCSEAISLGLVALNPDKTPYVIPEGRWFEGSMIPDFSNPETKKWWFGKRQHLLDMGVDGFKTDGGEFVYGNDVLFHDGRTGREMQNAYPLEYTRAYNEFIGSDRVLFSRAGYAGSSQTPMHWAGDQQSTWAELRHVLTAGLNAGLSGLPFWTFDIGGFAGELPSAELYLRAFALACFSPVVQWHSEPLGG